MLLYAALCTEWDREEPSYYKTDICSIWVQVYGKNPTESYIWLQLSVSSIHSMCFFLNVHFFVFSTSNHVNLCQRYPGIFLPKYQAYIWLSFGHFYLDSRDETIIVYGCEDCVLYNSKVRVAIFIDDHIKITSWSHATQLPCLQTKNIQNWTRSFFPEK